MDVEESKRYEVSQKKKKKVLRELKVSKGMDVEESKRYEVSQRKKKVPRGLKVLMRMDVDLEESKRYFFPNYPVEPWEEQSLSKVLDGPNSLSPPDAKLDHVLDVTSKLKDSIRKEFQKSTYYKTVIKPGQPVDIVSLLFPNRNDYLVRRNCRKVKAKSLKGKYVMVCSSYAPVCWPSSTWNVVLGSYEMYSKLKGKFEMVVVPKMRRGWTNNKDAFYQFLSAFPSSCLTVPYRAASRRRLICETIGGTLSTNILLVSPDGNALLHATLGHFDDLMLVPLNGSDPSPFPFISRKFVPDESLPRMAGWKLRSPSSLEGFLCCKTSDYVFREIAALGSDAFRKEKVCISELKSKPVGLYLYTTGHMVPLLRKIVQECRQNDKELEIVVVYVSIDCTSLLFPEVFSRVLAKRNISWWVAPFNYTASVLLKQLFEEEKVIIVGPNDLYVDVRGVELMQIYGMYAYPFTLDCVVQRTVEELRQVTLDSFSALVALQASTHPTAKKVLFYLDYPYEVCPRVFNAVTRFSMYEDVDVYCTSLVNEERFGRHAKNLKLQDCHHKDFTLKMPWLRKGADKCRKFLARFFNRVFPTIVAFGEDGRIRSLLAHELPFSDGPEIKGNLLKEVTSILEKYLSDYDYRELRYEPERGFFQELRRGSFWQAMGMLCDTQLIRVVVSTLSKVFNSAVLSIADLRQFYLFVEFEYVCSCIC